MQQNVNRGNALDNYADCFFFSLPLFFISFLFHPSSPPLTLTLIEEKNVRPRYLVLLMGQAFRRYLESGVPRQLRMVLLPGHWTHKHIYVLFFSFDHWCFFSLMRWDKIRSASLSNIINCYHEILRCLRPDSITHYLFYSQVYNCRELQVSDHHLRARVVHAQVYLFRLVLILMRWNINLPSMCTWCGGHMNNEHFNWNRMLITKFRLVLVELKYLIFNKKPNVQDCMLIMALQRFISSWYINSIRKKWFPRISHLYTPHNITVLFVYRNFPEQSNNTLHFHFELPFWIVFSNSFLFILFYNSTLFSSFFSVFVSSVVWSATVESGHFNTKKKVKIESLPTNRIIGPSVTIRQDW